VALKMSINTYMILLYVHLIRTGSFLLENLKSDLKNLAKDEHLKPYAHFLI
jgi:hypothetical protein